MRNSRMEHDMPNDEKLVPQMRGDSRLSRMLSPRHRTVAPALLVSLVATLLLMLAMRPFTAPALAEQAPVLEAPLVDWSVAKAVYQQADQWIKDDNVARDLSARPLLVSGVVAVRVTLRFGGLTLATADALGNTDKPQAPVDLRELTARATELALVKYHDARDRSFSRPDGVAPNAKDKSKAEPKANIIPLDLDLQIAHSPVGILLPANASPKAIYYQFAPGYHGLRLLSTATPPVTAMIWPANAIASNLRPDSQITQLLADAGYGPQDVMNMPAKIGRDGGPRLQRMEVIHLVRPFDGQPLAQLTRGNEIIPLDAVDMGTVESMAKRLSSHLTTRIIQEGPQPGTLTGTYLPTSDRYDPIEATPADTAIAGYALARRAARLGKADSNGLEYLNTKEKARVILDQLRSSLVKLKPTEGDAEAKALLLLTLVEVDYLAELKADRDKLGAALVNLPVSKGWFVNPASRSTVSPAQQAIILAALTGLYEQTRDEKLAGVIEAGMDTLWGSSLDVVDLVTAMPWMTSAAVKMHRLNLATQTDEGLRARERQRWSQRVEAVLKLSQSLRSKKLVSSPPKIGPTDVVGGYDLISETSDGAPAPDWRSAHVLAFLASINREPELVEGVKPHQMIYETTMTVRFLAQLMLDEPSMYYVRGARKDAINAVRLALWDNRLEVRPSAVTLLAITQLQETLGAKGR